MLLGLIAIFLSPITASAVSSNPTPNCSAGSTCTVTFTYTGDYYSWTVPTGIASVTVDAYGAQGGNTPNRAGGGYGGRVQATLAVTSGATLYIYVGGQGASNSTGGYNGGGTALNVEYGASGGGATHIATTSGVLSTLNSNQSSVLLVSGGGGGNGYYNNGGAGGGLTGAKGVDYYTVYYGGSGGTQSAGGAAGTGYCTNPVAGSFGQGGGNSSYHCTGGGGGWYGGGQGAVGGGGGGSSYTNATYSTSITHTQGSRSGNGQISFTYLNAPTPTSFTSAQTTPTKTNSSIAFAITFSQNVNSVADADFSNAGTASGCSFSISASSGTNLTLTISSCGEGTLIPQVIANSVFGTATSTNGPSANSQTSTPITIDRTAPTISAAITGPSNATYIPGQSLTFTAPFSETVTVTGTPRLALTIGSTSRYANYASGSNSRNLTFTYVVQTASADIDTDGIAVSTTLDLNSGAIADLATNALSPLTFTAPTLTSVLVAQTPAAPTITSITPSSGTLSVAFTAGATNGSAISNYQYSTNNGADWTTRSPIATTSPISISGLTNGTAYNVRIRAVNGAGSGDSSTAVSATPSAVVITGDATLTTTYGSAASTGTYTSAGGTGPYTYTLSATPSGVSIASGVVTASSSTAAGTYTQNVISTDSAGTPQTGLKQLVITINKASTTISISLPNAATDAALGGAITITATVSQAGSVNFKLGGSSISGCSSVTSSAGSATCSWTPGALGGASLTAVLTPTDSTNYENATTSTLSITVVNGVTTVSLALAGGVTQTGKGQNVVITATVDQAGRISFFVDGKRIPGCYNKAVSGSTKTCTWKPTIQKQVTLTSRLVPTKNAYSTATESMKVWVVRRTGTR